MVNEPSNYKKKKLKLYLENNYKRKNRYKNYKRKKLFLKLNENETKHTIHPATIITMQLA